ncbi:MAG: hypothetical protein HW401_739 [Parcubacteria group bacterium]|nr:hypothetical protein [Parcubacteria group bacterium]
MRYDHTKIFQSAYVLTIEIYRSSSKFSKEHKYTLGEKLKVLCGDLLDLIVVANAATNKLEFLKKLDLQLEKIKIYLRIAFDLKAISIGVFEVLSRKLDEIGRQLGGWRKWTEKQNCPSISARVSVNQDCGERAVKRELQPLSQI